MSSPVTDQKAPPATAPGSAADCNDTYQMYETLLTYKSKMPRKLPEGPMRIFFQRLPVTLPLVVSTAKNAPPYSICVACEDEKKGIYSTHQQCKHELLCRECYRENVLANIRDQTVMPWIRCPAPDCPCFLDKEDILAALWHKQTTASAGADCDFIVDLEPVLDLMLAFLRRYLVRLPEFVPCQKTGCRGGAMQFASLLKTKEFTCKQCKTTQLMTPRIVSRDDMCKDASTRALLEQGLMQQSPCCKLWVLKERGICNIIECEQCAVVWNFQTLETGTSIKALKEKARLQKTLWAKGDLEYQRELERTDPKAFRDLLQRAGVAYEKAYIRGT